MIEAKVICDSIGEHSPRLTTFQLRYLKFIHGEFMTHRAFSRNASSSRAIPVSKNLEEVRSNELRAGPVYWGAEQKGMASGEELDDEDKFRPDDDRGYYKAKTRAQSLWNQAAWDASKYAESLHKLGAHKSIVNRILEPFLHINVVATSCEPGLMNFFGLRLDKAAQPEIRVLAEQMWAVWNESRPRGLQPGEWHLPFVDEKTEAGAKEEHHRQFANPSHYRNDSLQGIKIKVSVARCARVSYLSFETGKRSTIEEDLKLYDRLVGSYPLHASPAEHMGTPDIYNEGNYKNPELHGNLLGWIQFRKTLPGEAIAPLPEGYSI